MDGMTPEARGLLTLLAGIFLAVGCPLLYLLWQVIKSDDATARAHKDAEALLNGASNDYYTRRRISAAQFQRQQEKNT